MAMLDPCRDLVLQSTASAKGPHYVCKKTFFRRNNIKYVFDFKPGSSDESTADLAKKYYCEMIEEDLDKSYDIPAMLGFLLWGLFRNIHLKLLRKKQSIGAELKGKIGNNLGRVDTIFCSEILHNFLTKCMNGILPKDHFEFNLDNKTFVRNRELFSPYEALIHMREKKDIFIPVDESSHK
jgi:hypothetical protein